MKVSNIKCNGMGPTHQARSSMSTIQTAISLFRMRYDNTEIIKMMAGGFDYHTGTRFNSDEAVSIRIATALVIESRIELRCEDPIIIEGYIKAFVDSLSGSEMDVLILEGMRDCASADHWYAFEKEWE